jgi:cystathionine beta-lyase
MSVNFDELPNRLDSECIKWHEFGADVLPMWVADMDFRSPDAVIQALHERVEHGVFGYPCNMPDLAEAVVERMQARYGWQIKPEDVILTPGVVTGFNWVCQALAQAGEAVLVQTPVYPPFLSAPRNAGLKRQEAPLVRQDDGRYEIDFDVFEAAITPETKVFILCNPHNPVGRVFTEAELRRMAEICLRHGVMLCADEIHSDLIYSGYRHIPVASLSPEIADQTITLIAPSKTFNIAGLECSAAIVTNPELRNKLQHGRRGLVGGVNVLGQVAGLAAYRHGQEWLEQLMVYLEGNRDTVAAYLKKNLPQVQMAVPEATYLAWWDCRALKLEPNPSEWFLKHARVAVNDGATFGKGGEGFVRFNFGCPRSMVTEALERMRIALESR